MADLVRTWEEPAVGDLARVQGWVGTSELAAMHRRAAEWQTQVAWVAVWECIPEWPDLQWEAEWAAIEAAQWEAGCQTAVASAAGCPWEADLAEALWVASAAADLVAVALAEDTWEAAVMEAAATVELSELT